jgi:hypothetical protein
MCGRFARKSPAKKITKKFKVEEVPPPAERHNVAPAQAVLDIRESSGVREATFFKWGSYRTGRGTRPSGTSSSTRGRKPSRSSLPSAGLSRAGGICFRVAGKRKGAGGPRRLRPLAWPAPKFHSFSEGTPVR